MRRVCLILAILTLSWAVIVAFTGGISFDVGAVRVSSRHALNPLLVAAAVMAAAWMLAPREGRAEILVTDLSACAAPTVVAVISTAVAATGLIAGAPVAGGSDSYGYVSQAQGWAAGNLNFEEPLIREFAGRISRDAFVPLGYHAIGEHGRIVPTYSPGLPMLMGLFHRIGGPDAVFSVVPVLAGVAIWGVYVMGLRLAGKAVGLSAAVILATSPSFLFQTTAAPMSDVPVAAWWAVSLGLVLFNNAGSAFSAGLAAGLAILTRPNLAPLALIPFAAMSMHSVRRALVFAAGVVPGCLAVAALFTFWYGSPLISGYGSPTGLYQWENLWPNLARYPSWVAETQTPIVFAAFAAPWLIARVARPETRLARIATVAMLGFVLAVLVSYLFFEAFNAVWFVRFILPAFPSLFVLASVAIVASTTRLSVVGRVLVPVSLLGIIASNGLAYAYRHRVFDAYTERKYAAAGEYVAARLPSKAAVLSSLHSGSIRYYSGRATVRFDVIPPHELDSTLSALESSGYRPFFLLEPSEIPLFQKRYATYSALAPLDWPPIARFRSSNISVYDPADRQRALSGQPPLTEILP